MQFWIKSAACYFLGAEPSRAEPGRAEPSRAGQSETNETETDQLEGGGPIAFCGQMTVFFVHLLSHKWLLRGRPDFEIIGLASYWLIYDWRAWFRKPITKNAGNTCTGAIIAKSAGCYHFFASLTPVVKWICYVCVYILFINQDCLISFRLPLTRINLDDWRLI